MKYNNLVELKKAHLAVMTDYQTDLDYDFDNIAKNRNTDFIIINRGSGTSLLMLYSADKFPIKKYEEKAYIFGLATREYFLKDNYEGTVKHYSKEYNKPALITYHDSKKDIDTKINVDQLKNIVSDYCKSIRNNWLIDDIRKAV